MSQMAELLENFLLTDGGSVFFETLPYQTARAF